MSNRSPRYEIVRQNQDVVVIRDTGHDQGYRSVTNGAEEVVAELAPMLSGRRLEYYDSDGELGRLLVKEGRFAGFAPL